MSSIACGRRSRGSPAVGRAGLGKSRRTRPHSQDELAALLPEDASAIEETISLIELDTDALLAELSAAAERNEAASPRLLSFTVLPADEEAVERAIGLAGDGLEGRNHRGPPLPRIARPRSAAVPPLGTTQPAITSSSPRPPTPPQRSARELLLAMDNASIT